MLPILPKNTVYSQVRLKKDPSVTRNTAKQLGIFFIYIAAFLLLITQVLPLGISYAKNAMTDTFSGKTDLPISEAFLQKLVSVQYTDPGADYFITVVSHQKVTPAKIDTTYNQAMHITIPAAKINNILVSPNVPGSEKDQYEGALFKGVAHLKGTPLPGSGGASIIYGHSGLSGIFANPNNPQIIFSRLDAVSIGDSILIQKDNTQLQYLVSSKKIIETGDVTFLSSVGQKEKVILITCWPLGIGTTKLVLIAERSYE